MFALMLLAASAAPVPVHAGRFDPADFPGAQKVERRMPHADLNHRVEKILASGQCRLSGQNKKQFDIVVPYALLLSTTGAASRVVVQDIGCQQIERLAGEVAVELSKAGDFKPQLQTGSRWYVSEVSFTRLNERASDQLKDPNKVVCRASTPVVGSRVAMAKVCRTVAEWKLFVVDRDQLHRDLRGLPDPTDSK